MKSYNWYCSFRHIVYLVIDYFFFLFQVWDSSNWLEWMWHFLRCLTDYLSRSEYNEKQRAQQISSSNSENEVKFSMSLGKQFRQVANANNIMQGKGWPMSTQGSSSSACSHGSPQVQACMHASSAACNCTFEACILWCQITCNTIAE